QHAVAVPAADTALDRLARVAQGLPGAQHVLVDEVGILRPAGQVLVARGHLPAVGDLPGHAEGGHVLAAELVGNHAAAVLAVDLGIVPGVGRGGVEAFADRALEYDVDTLGSALADVGERATRAILVDHQVVEVLVIGLRQHRPAVVEEILDTGARVRDLLVLQR